MGMSLTKHRPARVAVCRPRHQVAASLSRPQEHPARRALYKFLMSILDPWTLSAGERRPRKPACGLNRFRIICRSRLATAAPSFLPRRLCDPTRRAHLAAEALLALSRGAVEIPREFFPPAALPGPRILALVCRSHGRQLSCASRVSL